MTIGIGNCIAPANRSLYNGVAGCTQNQIRFCGNTDDEGDKVTLGESCKEKVADFWKFGSTTKTMIGATVRGLAYGALTGAALLGGSWLFKTLPKAFSKEGPKLWEVIRHPLKNTSWKCKAVAYAGSAAVTACTMLLGKLEANKNTADIDHKLKTGHRDV